MTKPYPDMTREACTDRAEVVRNLTRLGHTAAEIAHDLGVTRYTVIRYRRRLGIAKNVPPRLSRAQVDQARTLVEGGASIAETARTVGCSEWAIRVRFPGRAWTHKQRTDYITMLAKLDPDYAEWRNRWWGHETKAGQA